MQNKKNTQQVDALHPADGQAEQHIHLGDFVNETDARADQQEGGKQREHRQRAERGRKAPVLDRFDRHH